MPTVDVRNVNGDVVGQLELAAEVFDVPFNDAVVHQVTTGQLANRRQGNAKARTRGEVSGGGSKPYRQKGTGRARQGSIRAVQFKGGGIAFGPQPKSWRTRLPRRLRRNAVRQILSDKIRENSLVVIDEFKLNEIKTRSVVELLASIDAGRRVLLVVGEESPVVVRSAANLENVQVELADRVNALDALRAHTIVATRQGAERLQEMYRS